MAHLYINAKGYPVTTHSYSGGRDFAKCPRFYQLSRIKGWKERKQNAALEFGKCVESALQRHHEEKMAPKTGVHEFERLWLTHKDRTDLTYTAKEGDWADMAIMGKEMLALYEVKVKSFGYRDPKWQLNYRKAVFTGSYLKDLEYSSYIDMLAQMGEPENPVPVIIDIKTSSTALDDDVPALLALDPQLRAYAHITGVPLVGFLWFQKARPEGYKRGDKVTLLANKAHMQAGDPGVVLAADTIDGAVMVAAVVTPKQFIDYQIGSKGLRGKKADEFQAEFGRKHGTAVYLDQITKQKLQFVYTRIPDEDVKEAGEAIGLEIVNIHHSSQTGSFPKTPGVRWPQDYCKYCCMLPICTGNDEARDANLVQIGAAPSSAKLEERDWIDEILS